MHKVLYTACTFSPEQIGKLKTEQIEIIPAKHNLTEQELIEALTGMEGYILGGDEIATKKVIETTKDLKIIAFLGTGYEKYVDIKAATEKGIFVTNTPAANSSTVAEYTVALILDAVKKITYSNNSTKKGCWEKYKVWNLEGKTLGIIGMGAVGSKVAKIMHDGFGMKILYFSRTSKLEIEKELHAKKENLDQLVKDADVISIHASYSPETINLIREKEFSLMKPSVIFVNSARAEIVDGKALYKALNGGKISSAAFDNYYQEPVPVPEKDEYRLLSLPDDKFIITPHNAYNSTDAVKAMEGMILESVRDVFAGKKPRYLVV